MVWMLVVWLLSVLLLVVVEVVVVGQLRSLSLVRAATLQKCGSEIFVRFSLRKVS